MLDTDLIAEMRADMLEESRREHLQEAQMHRDFDFFLKHIDFSEFQELAHTLRLQCTHYGYDFKDILDLI